MSAQGLWGATLRDPIQAPPLESDLQVDLAIIGGGFTGCSAALEAARQGARVALVEAQTIGHGGSGRNVGLVNAGLWLPPETILAQMGDAPGRRLIDALGSAPDLVFDLIAREAITCEATRAGTLHLAHAPGGLADLENRHRQGNAFGAALHLLDADEARRRTGSDAFHGALWNPQAGTVQPLAYCHGLARAAQRAGAQIFARTPVTGIAQDNGLWRLDTARGQIRAGKLLQATNAYPSQAARPRQAQYITVQYCQFATVPMPDALRAQILPGGEGCWDTATVMSSVRVDQAGRLIVGGMGHGQGAGGPVHAAWARRKLRSLYPALADLPFEHAWSGRIAMTGDHLPRVQALGPGGLSILGYSGRGIAPGTVFGTAAAQALLSDDMQALPLAVTPPQRESLAGVKSAVLELGATLTHAIGARQARR